MKITQVICRVLRAGTPEAKTSSCQDAVIVRVRTDVEDHPLRHELTLERTQAVGGMIEVPDRPGLGVTVNEDFVRASLVAESGT